MHVLHNLAIMFGLVFTVRLKALLAFPARPSQYLIANFHKLFSGRGGRGGILLFLNPKPLFWSSRFPTGSLPSQDWVKPNNELRFFGLLLIIGGIGNQAAEACFLSCCQDKTCRSGTAKHICTYLPASITTTNVPLAIPYGLATRDCTIGPYIVPKISVEFTSGVVSIYVSPYLSSSYFAVAAM